jgi:hypothetical protein
MREIEEEGGRSFSNGSPSDERISIGCAAIQ